MKKIFANALAVMAMSVAVVSCADYNETGNFRAEPDPSVKEPYKDLLPVNSYIDRVKYPNMTLGASLKVVEFNKQELSHAAAVTNFDNLTFGNTLMSGTIINEKGVMNFLNMNDLLAHTEEINAEVFGSPIVANENQPDAWIKRLTAPIEIEVKTEVDMSIDFSKETTIDHYTIESGKAPTIEKYNGDNVLSVKKSSKVRMFEIFDVDPTGTYTITFYARNATAGKEQSFNVNFSGEVVMDNDAAKKFNIPADKWVKVSMENVHPSPDAEKGYLMLYNFKNSDIYIRNITISHAPDNHRPQTAEEINDTIHYALNTWCNGMMEINNGRIKSFDLIDEPIDSKTLLDNKLYDLKHSDTDIYWQDIFGSENYAPVVANAARKAFEENNGNPADLKLFIAENGLEDETKLNSLKHWIGIWDQKGAKIDGITAKLDLTFYEDVDKQAEALTTYDKLLANLASSGKLIRITNFDVKYQNASGTAVTAEKITDEQRQKLADYYALLIKKYMEVIPNELQAGIVKGNLADTTDPVGLWSVNKQKDWVRTATYKAFCEALSGK